MSSIVLQRFARVSMLGMDIEARTDLADEPVIEAEDLGRLLEYQRPRDCRDLVRRLVDAGRLSRTARSSTAPQNSADNSGLSSTTDVYAAEVIEPHGVRLGTTEQLWLTERACLLVATASDTERAWQVRTALVDFFLAARSGRDIGYVNPMLAMVDEMRTIRAEVVQALEPQRMLAGMIAGIDTRLHDIEARGGLMGVPLLNDVVASDPPTPTPSTLAKRDAEGLMDDLEAAIALAKVETIGAREALWVYPQIARFGRSAAALGAALRFLKGLDFNGRAILSVKEGQAIRWWVKKRDHEPARTD